MTFVTLPHILPDLGHLAANRTYLPAVPVRKDNEEPIEIQLDRIEAKVDSLVEFMRTGLRG